MTQIRYVKISKIPSKNLRKNSLQSMVRNFDVSVPSPRLFFIWLPAVFFFSLYRCIFYSKYFLISLEDEFSGICAVINLDGRKRITVKFFNFHFCLLQFLLEKMSSIGLLVQSITSFFLLFLDCSVLYSQFIDFLFQFPDLFFQCFDVTLSF